MQTALFTLGLVLFLLGLLTGLAVPALKNARMGLSSHLEGCSTACSWCCSVCCGHTCTCPTRGGIAAVALVTYAGYANWLTVLLAAAWGAGRRFAPIAAGDHQASAAKEGFVSFGLASLSVAIVVGVVIVIVGVLVGQ